MPHRETHCGYQRLVIHPCRRSSMLRRPELLQASTLLKVQDNLMKRCVCSSQEAAPLVLRVSCYDAATLAGWCCDEEKQIFGLSAMCYAAPALLKLHSGKQSHLLLCMMRDPHKAEKACGAEMQPVSSTAKRWLAVTKVCSGDGLPPLLEASGEEMGRSSEVRHHDAAATGCLPVLQEALRRLQLKATEELGFQAHVWRRYHHFATNVY